jgi:hypothetical protein
MLSLTSQAVDIAESPQSYPRPTVWSRSTTGALEAAQPCALAGGASELPLAIIRA